MLCGLLRPTSGTAIVGGDRRGGRSGRRQAAHRLHVAAVLALRVADGRSEHPLLRRRLRADAARLEARRAFVIEMAGLRGREHALARDLAGGWRQRLALGCAILHEPAILFLDEPTGGVDPLSRRQFWRLIDTLAASGVTMLVTTHYLDEAERCHRVTLIHAGRLAAIGTTRKSSRCSPAGRSSRCGPRARPTRCGVLDEMPDVEKTSLFGTAVHAVLRGTGADAEALADAPARRRHSRRIGRAGVPLARRRLPRRRRTRRAARRAAS